jgi:hypothetical protein
VNRAFLGKKIPPTRRFKWELLGIAQRSWFRMRPIDAAVLFCGFE